MKQIILSANDNYAELSKFFKENNIDNLFVVCLKSIKKLNIYNYLKKIDNIKITYFNSFSANPKYESVCEGVKLFNESGCKYILAIGGGSAMDVAKCIKLYSTLDSNNNYLEQDIIENDIRLLAVPTTAGTGSEATKFAVIYYNNIKQSVSHDSCIPSVVLFDSSLLDSLPPYQKKSTVLDALCHAFESMWSVNSSNESKEYSKKAISIINKNFEQYLLDNHNVNEEMLFASNLAGKAINITQTTAGHAMCYKLTSLYGISHGHAAALINSELLPYMLNNLDHCIDKRGSRYLGSIFEELSSVLGLSNIVLLGDYFNDILEKYDLYDVDVDINDIDDLVDSVNVTRLKNNPIKLSKIDIRKIYTNLFQKIERMKKNGSKRIN